MYDVNALPSTSTSTRRWASRGTTSIWGLGARGSGLGNSDPRIPSPKPPSISSHALRMLSAHHDIALGVVEHDLAAGVHRRHGHEQRNRVTVVRVDARASAVAKWHAVSIVLLC